jgi:cell division initiation protein
VSERRRVPLDVRSVAFPVAGRGYNRRAVDAYVTQVNRAIAELEATRSPQSAIEHALERTEVQRRRILEEARTTAVEIIEAAEREAEELISAAKGEAVSIVVNASDAADRTMAEADEHVGMASKEAERIVAEAGTEAADRLQRTREEIEVLHNEAEAWMRALRLDTNAIWGERRDLLEDLREIAARLQKAASHSAAPTSSDQASA